VLSGNARSLFFRSIPTISKGMQPFSCAKPISLPVVITSFSFFFPFFSFLDVGGDKIPFFLSLSFPPSYLRNSGVMITSPFLHVRLLQEKA